MRSTHTLAVRSQQWIVDALLRLLQKKKLEDITISAICEQAGVSRRTFYRNFSDKYDVLSYYFLGLEEEYKQMLMMMSPPDFSSFLQTYVCFWRKHFAFLVSAKKDASLFAMLLQILNTWIPSIYQADASPAIRYDLYFVIGGFHNVLINWLQNDQNTTIEEIMQQLTQLLRSDISFKPNMNK